MDSAPSLLSGDDDALSLVLMSLPLVYNDAQMPQQQSLPTRTGVEGQLPLSTALLSAAAAGATIAAGHMAQPTPDSSGLLCAPASATDAVVIGSSRTSSVRNKALSIRNSCDKCRHRKTKCDGLFPCGQCCKQFVLTAKQIEDIRAGVMTQCGGVSSVAKASEMTADKAATDSESKVSAAVALSASYGCVYSVAKRRGPITGNRGLAAGTKRKSTDGEKPPGRRRSSKAAATEDDDEEDEEDDDDDEDKEESEDNNSENEGDAGDSADDSARVAEKSVELLDATSVALTSSSSGARKPKQRARSKGARGGSDSYIDPPMSSLSNIMALPDMGWVHPTRMGLDPYSQSGISQQQQQQQMQMQLQMQMQMQMQVAQHNMQHEQQQRSNPMYNTYNSATMYGAGSSFPSAVGGFTMPYGAAVLPEVHTAASASAAVAEILGVRGGAAQSAGTGALSSGASPAPLLSPFLSVSSNDKELFKAAFLLGPNQLFRLPLAPPLDLYSAQGINRSETFLLEGARSMEYALGVLARDRDLAALANSAITFAIFCLKNCYDTCVSNPWLAQTLFQVAYYNFLVGDLQRYYVYRRLALVALSTCQPSVHSWQIKAAITINDTESYLLLDGNVARVPVACQPRPKSIETLRLKRANLEATVHGSQCDANLMNEDQLTFIQGKPSVFQETTAQNYSRVLDAIACAIRGCCDGGTNQLCSMLGQPVPEGCGFGSATMSIMSDELSPPNLLQEASFLLDSDEAASPAIRYEGVRILHKIMMLKFFIGNPSRDTSLSLETTGHLKEIVEVANMVIGMPSILMQGGVTYHSISNLAIIILRELQGHLREDQRAKGTAALGAESGNRVSSFISSDVLASTYMCLHSLLHRHRSSMHPALRCHDLPRLPFDTAGALALTTFPICKSACCTVFAQFGMSPCAKLAEEIEANRFDTLAQEEEFEADFDFNFDDDWALSLF